MQAKILSWLLAVQKIFGVFNTSSNNGYILRFDLDIKELAASLKEEKATRSDDDLHDDETLKLYLQPGSGKTRSKIWKKVGFPPLQARAGPAPLASMKAMNFINTGRSSLDLVPFRRIIAIDNIHLNSDCACYGEFSW